MKPFLIIALALTIFSCKNNDENDSNVIVTNPNTPGLAYSLSGSDFNTTYTALSTLLQNNSAISIVAEVDHTSNAAGIGQTLANTRLILFGNPMLGTALMQENQLAGLDLPQKMLVYKNSDDNVFIGYNTTEYLTARHNVGGASTIQQIKAALANISNTITDAPVEENSSASVTANKGIITVVSQNDFSTTYNSLRDVISGNANLSIIAELDHQANAQSVDMVLNPTRLIVFGNPAAGTPLMQNSQVTGVDLPQKMLVYEDANGAVKVSYNDPNYLVERHSITGNETLLENINNALSNIASAATN